MNESLRSQLVALRSQAQATVDMCNVFLGECRHENAVDVNGAHYCLDCQDFIYKTIGAIEDPLPTCPHPETDLVNVTTSGMKRMQFRCKRCGEIVEKEWPKEPVLVGEKR
jgi:hypothetical protein